MQYCRMWKFTACIRPDYSGLCSGRYHCGWGHRGCWCTNILCIASICVWFESCKALHKTGSMSGLLVIKHYDFEVVDYAMRPDLSICSVKDWCGVYHSGGSAWFDKFRWGCKKSDNQAMNSAAVPLPIAVNTLKSIGRLS